MIPNQYIKNGCFTKHPFINGCLGFQVVICNSTDFPDFTFHPKKKGEHTHTQTGTPFFSNWGTQFFFQRSFSWSVFENIAEKTKNPTPRSQGAKITTVNVDEFQRRIGSMRDDAEGHTHWPMAFFFWYMAEKFSGGEKTGRFKKPPLIWSESS